MNKFQKKTNVSLLSRPQKFGCQQLDKTLSKIPQIDGNDLLRIKLLEARLKGQHAAVPREDTKNVLDSAESADASRFEFAKTTQQISEFEDNTLQLANTIRHSSGARVSKIESALGVLADTFKDTLGNDYCNFMLAHKKSVTGLHQVTSNDRRPLWKVLIDQGQCDVLSILEEQDKPETFLQLAKREQTFRVLNQSYLQKNWIDHIFLRSLADNENLLMPQFSNSAPILERLIKAKSYATMAYVRLLHARCPLYAMESKGQPNKKVREEHKEKFLKRTQYKNHRNMLEILKEMHFLKNENRMKELRAFVEAALIDFVSFKTQRVMPCKFKFVNEVCNIFALALLEQIITAPRDFVGRPQREHMTILFRLSTKTHLDPQPYEFGKRNTTNSDDGTIQKELEVRLRKGLENAQYHIWKAYLWHEISRINLKRQNYKKCCKEAEMAIGEAKQCNSNIWEFLAQILICKALCLQMKLEAMQQALQQALRIANTLNSSRITEFIQLCISENSKDLLAKKTRLRLEEEKMKKSR